MTEPLVGAPGEPVRSGGGGGGRDGGGGGAGGGGAAAEGGAGDPEGGGRDGSWNGRTARGHLAVLGIWVALAPILMMFLAFASAYVVRQGLGQGWVRIEVPAIVWVNTLVLLGSSLVLERGRRSGRAGDPSRSWLLATLGLGTLFLVGQLAAWRQLAGQGIGMSTSPHSAFFFLLTGAHGVHLLGGWLGLAAAAFWPEDGVGSLSRPAAVRVSAIYWHFMGVLWVGLLLLLVLRG